jgi:hypothetical protein
MMADITRDKAEIYQVLVDYCYAADTCDEALALSVFHTDSYDDHGVFKGNGQDFARFLIQNVQQWFLLTKHTIMNVSYDMRGDEADVICQVNAYHEIAGQRDRVEAVFGPSYAAEQDWNRIAGVPHEFIYSGRYYDRFAKRDGQWKIARRIVEMDWYKVGLTRTIADEGIFATFRENERTRRHKRPRTSPAASVAAAL